MTLSDEQRARAVHLIDRLRSGLLDDGSLSLVVEQLDGLLPDPDWYSYTIDAQPELTADQVVTRASAYRPITL